MDFSGKGKVVLFGLECSNEYSSTICSFKTSEGVESLELFLVNLPPYFLIITGFAIVSAYMIWHNLFLPISRCNRVKVSGDIDDTAEKRKYREIILFGKFSRW